MPYSDLQAFLADLEARGQLKRTRAEFDPIPGISAVADRVSKLPAADYSPPPLMIAQRVPCVCRAGWSTRR